MIFTDQYRKISWRGRNLEKKMSHLDQQAVEKKTPSIEVMMMMMILNTMMSMITMVVMIIMVSFDEDDDLNNGRECFSSTHVKLNEEKKLKKRVDQLETFCASRLGLTA